MVEGVEKVKDAKAAGGQVAKKKQEQNWGFMVSIFAQYLVPGSKTCRRMCFLKNEALHVNTKHYIHNVCGGHRP